MHIVDNAEISYEFENWPDPMIIVRVMASFDFLQVSPFASIGLLWRMFVTSVTVSFCWVITILADNQDSH